MPCDPQESCDAKRARMPNVVTPLLNPPGVSLLPTEVSGAAAARRAEELREARLAEVKKEAIAEGWAE